MNKKKLKDVWQTIKRKKKCRGCPLLKMPQLIMKANGPVKGMVITEGPNKEEKDKHIASFGNHPTYTFLYTLFSGKAKFICHNANVYWTHIRKCFLTNKKDKRNDDKKALRLCRKYYLEEEIQALKPKFIVAVGRKALQFFRRHDYRLSGNLENVVFRKKGIFENVKLGDLCFRLVVLPHPSGRSRVWANLSSKDYNILEEIRENLDASLSG